jgi:hypothetical protein
LLGLRHRRTGEQRLPQVAVTEAVDAELTPAERLDQRSVGRRERVQWAYLAAIALCGAAQPGGQFAERGGVLD